MALPRNSFVRAALAHAESVATLLRGTFLAWWAGDLSLRDPLRDAAQDAASRRPQPLTRFPELSRLIVHEPWLADPTVRAQRVWTAVGWDAAEYAYFILSNGHMPTLGILMRDHSPAYLRLHFNYAFAALDGALWAHEIHAQPVGRPLIWGGIDPARHGTWSVRVVPRDRRCELQITRGGLIPRTYDYRSLEDAAVSAEAWVTDFLHADEDHRGTRHGRSHNGRAVESERLM